MLWIKIDLLEKLWSESNIVVIVIVSSGIVQVLAAGFVAACVIRRGRRRIVEIILAGLIGEIMEGWKSWVEGRLLFTTIQGVLLPNIMDFSVVMFLVMIFTVEGDLGVHPANDRAVLGANVESGHERHECSFPRKSTT